MGLLDTDTFKMQCKQKCLAEDYHIMRLLEQQLPCTELVTTVIVLVLPTAPVPECVL